MKHLIIIGAGGLAREVYNIAICSIGYGEVFDVKGFLDIDKRALDSYEGYPPVIGDERSYDIQENDVFVAAIGNNEVRKKVIEIICDKGGKFYTIIHKTSILNTNTKVGEGCIIFPRVYIGSDSIIGDYTFIQNNAVLGHDVRIGSYCRIDCNVVFVGGTCSDDGVTIHTNTVINHGVHLYEWSVIAACSFVIRNVNPFTTVMGNPAKKLFEKKQS